MVFVAVWKSRLCAAAARKEADGWLSDFASLSRNIRDCSINTKNLVLVFFAS
jgi:uncharacterized protein YcbX